MANFSGGSVIGRHCNGLESVLSMTAVFRKERSDIYITVKRGNIPLAENPYVISAWAVWFSPPFVSYYSTILDIIHKWPIDSY